MSGIFLRDELVAALLPEQRFRALLGAGYAETTMAQVLGTNEQMVTLPLSHPKTGNRPRGTVSIRMDELEHQHDLVTLKLRALQARHFVVKLSWEAFVNTERAIG